MVQKNSKREEEWIKVKKQTGRIARSKNKAKEVIPELLKTRSASIRLFERKMGTQRYISATKKEGINLNYTGVRRALGDLGIVQKMPKLRAQGSMVKITKNAKKYDDISKLSAAF